MPCGILVAREQPRPRPGDSNLLVKRLKSQIRERNLGDPVWSFRIRNPNHRVSQVHLLLLHRYRFLVHPEASFSDDPDDIAQVLGPLELDPLLLRPRHVVRSKQPLHLYGKFHSRAGVGRQQFLTNCDVHHTAKHPQFLMDGCRLKPISLNDRMRQANTICTAAGVGDAVMGWTNKRRWYRSGGAGVAGKLSNWWPNTKPAA